MKCHNGASRKRSLRSTCDNSSCRSSLNLLRCPGDCIKSCCAGGREACCLPFGLSFDRHVTCCGMGRIFKTCPWTDEASIEECLEVRLMYVRQSIHRRTQGNLNALWWNPGCVQASIGAGHLRGGNGELAKATSHPARRAGHPLLDVE